MDSLAKLSDTVLLVICDGMGYSANTPNNAVYVANTPNLDRYFKEFPFTTIQPGGTSVGLPEGVAGNSEVGHMNIGAGRPIRQDLVRINESITNDTLKDKPKMKELIDAAKKGSKRVHLMGLLSDGGVHSHINHVKAIIDILNQHKDLKVFLHAFTDGRDTAQDSGIRYIKEILEHGNFTFASMGGRSIGMDRDRRWEKIKKAYDAMTGRSGTVSESPVEYIQKCYSEKVYDEFLPHVLFDEDAAITSEDAVFFFNFRPDRARQISLAFCDPNFGPFDNTTRPQYFLCMSPCIDEEMPLVPVLFDREKVQGTLSEYVSSLGKKQLKIAETEKYAHVTYFLNGGEEKPFDGEERILIPSPKEVATYDQKPEMSAYLVLEALSEKLHDKSFSLYIVNFANPDMVGHTGNFPAAVKAMEVVDECLGKLESICKDEGITMLVTADHGNCDQMTYEDNAPHTSHSKSRVPFIVINDKLKNKKLTLNDEKDNALKDVAPTILNVLGYNIPDNFTGHSIFA